ncbi:MAG: methionine--tRNA ligase [Gammaproteobacteria bacterium]|nr:methionine--tRNA ligase [Gammaproteobacteria bacterium]MCW5583516.1 methionine--tRNA ligase [Gammaproteobacteria bacterium]
MSDKRKILVTNALPYANGPLHLGHMVGYIQADIWVRLQKMLGHDCIYICGSDSHGTPIMIQAEKIGLSPEVMIERVQHDHEKDFSDFHVGFDNYYTTHSEENKQLVETIFKRHLAAGNIVKRIIKQLFDPVKNMFLPDRYIKGECPNCNAKDQYGDNCEVCGTTYLPTDLKNAYSTLSGAKPIEKESEHYFFQLQNYEKFLKAWTRHGHLQEQVTNKLDEWFKNGLREWDISRDAPYFGFKIPGEKDKYFYVWLDAPIGYIASFKNLCARKKELNFDEYWNKTSQTELYHFIGKDIIYFHALFWPATLEGAEFRTPTAIFVNGYLTIDGQKMSKSRGTFIKARTYLNHLQPEYLRYYFAAKLSNRIEDLDVNFDDFTQRINSDLVGKFINIASRCASFINKYFSGKLSAQCAEQSLYQDFASVGDSIANSYKKLEYSHAIRQIMALADRANQYIDEKKPWALIKDANRQQEVEEVCSVGINLFRVLMIYLKPVLPQTAEQVEAFLNIAPLQWNDKDTPLLNHIINEFQPLINRIDPKQIEAMKMAAQQDIEKSTNTPAPNVEAATPTKAPVKESISIEDFNKIDLRIAKILEAEAIEGADKLLRLKVELVNETRQIFAGIKSAYQPEQLIGRQVIIVANLAPRKMRFGVSEGMVIAASGEDNANLFLVSPDPGAQPGMRVK